MYSEDIGFWSTGAGAVIGVVLAAVVLWKHIAGGASKKDTATYTLSALITPIMCGLFIGGWAMKHFPPRDFPMQGLVDQTVTSAAAFEAGEHCLVGPEGDRHHPTIRAYFDRFSRKFTSRQRLKVEREEIKPVATEGRFEGLHIYTIVYNYREKKSDSNVMPLKLERKDFWVRTSDCAASRRSTDSSIGAVLAR